jgi:segregation and condensation protein B
MTEEFNLKHIVEGVVFANTSPITVDKLHEIVSRVRVDVTKDDLRNTLTSLKKENDNRGVHLVEVASGYQYRVATKGAEFLRVLWQEKPPRYSKSVLETLALIAYRQPITRAEIQEVRGVAVSTDTTRLLLDREWVKIVGHRDLPGKPALFATTKEFLDYFNLKKLSDLPPLDEVRDLEAMGKQLEMDLAVDPPPPILLEDDDEEDDEEEEFDDDDEFDEDEEDEEEDEFDDDLAEINSLDEVKELEEEG